jgi:hypothetical protein
MGPAFWVGDEALRFAGMLSWREGHSGTDLVSDSLCGQLFQLSFIMGALRRFSCGKLDM